MRLGSLIWEQIIGLTCFVVGEIKLFWLLNFHKFNLNICFVRILC